MKNKILIVEDDKTVLKLLVEFLVRSGFKTITASSAENGSEILKREEINMVITDIKLPGIDGIKFTKKIKTNYNLDVIVMTAYSSKYSYEDAIKNGASDLIFKPIRYNELLLRINRVLKERSILKERDSMIEELKRLTIEDPLTKLFNSRHFYAQLENEINRSDRYLHPLSLIFIDVDNFKIINDIYGHMIGDQILSAIASIFKTCLRSQDTAYRFAGDEFTVILPETKADKAKVVAERIRLNLENESLIVCEKEISKITVSIGISEYQRNEEKEQFIHRADETMYEAKKSGGNKVRISPEASQLSENFTTVTSLASN